MNFLLYKHFAALQEAPPRKRLWSKEGAGLSCIFQTKRKHPWAKHSIPSGLSLPCSWKTVWGVKTQSTKVCAASFLETAPLGPCCPLHSAAGWEHSWPDVARPGADVPVQMLHSRIAGPCAHGGGSVTPGTAPPALSPTPWAQRAWERSRPGALCCLKAAVRCPPRF